MQARYFLKLGIYLVENIVVVGSAEFPSPAPLSVGIAPVTLSVVAAPAALLDVAVPTTLSKSAGVDVAVMV